MCLHFYVVWAVVVVARWKKKKDDPDLTQFDLVHRVSNCVASAVVLVMLRELEQVLGGNLI